MSRQKHLVQESLFQAAKAGPDLDTSAVVDVALQRDRELHDGQVFHRTQTPRASVRRTLHDLEGDGLVIRDGQGHLRIRISALVDSVVHGDALSLLRLCPDGSLPFVHADPAWSHLEVHMATGTTTRMLGAGMRWFHTPDLPEEVIREIHRVLKPGGVFLCWFPPLQESAQAQWDMIPVIHATGFRPLREVTWDKGKGTGYGWAPSSEPCFVFFKHHRPPFYDLSVTNLIRHPRLRAEDKTAYTDYTAEDQAHYEAVLAKYEAEANIPEDVRATLKQRAHGCEKPVQVLIQLLKPILGPGKHGQAPEGENLVVDLYSGSGSACVAARRLGGHYCAVELDQRNVEHLLVPRLGPQLLLRLET